MPAKQAFRICKKNREKDQIFTMNELGARDQYKKLIRGRAPRCSLRRQRCHPSPSSAGRRCWVATPTCSPDRWACAHSTGPRGQLSRRREVVLERARRVGQALREVGARCVRVARGRWWRRASSRPCRRRRSGSPAPGMAPSTRPAWVRPAAAPHRTVKIQNTVTKIEIKINRAADPFLIIVLLMSPDLQPEGVRA